MTTITHRHCREAGYCNRGLRELCAREGIDWPDFLRNGIDAVRLRNLNNAMAEKVIALAENEHGQQ